MAKMFVIFVSIVHVYNQQFILNWVKHSTFEIFGYKQSFTTIPQDMITFESRTTTAFLIIFYQTVCRVTRDLTIYYQRTGAIEQKKKKDKTMITYLSIDQWNRLESICLEWVRRRN